MNTHATYSAESCASPSDRPGKSICVARPVSPPGPVCPARRQLTQQTSYPFPAVGSTIPYGPRSQDSAPFEPVPWTRRTTPPGLRCRPFGHVMAFSRTARETENGASDRIAAVDHIRCSRGRFSANGSGRVTRTYPRTDGRDASCASERATYDGNKDQRRHSQCLVTPDRSAG